VGNIFYVYLHVKKTNGDVFYVGKGKEGRDKSRSGRSAHWRNIVAKHDYEIIRIAEGLSEDDSYLLETDTILKMRTEGASICNIASGGNGGLSGTSLSKEHKEKLRKAKLGKRQLPDHARKSATAKIGKKQPRRAVDFVISKKMKPVINSSGEIFESTVSASKAVSKRLGIKASQGNISMCATGGRNNAYGLTWSYETSSVPKFRPTTSPSKKTVCSNGMRFLSVKKAREWVISWRGSATHQSISDAARNGGNAYGLGWEYKNEIIAN